MGASSSKPTGKPDLNAANTRGQAITGAARAKAAEQRTRPDDALSVESKDFPFAIQALQKLLVFSRTDPALLEKVVQGMWQRECDAGAPCPAEIQCCILPRCVLHLCAAQAVQSP